MSPKTLHRPTLRLGLLLYGALLVLSVVLWLDMPDRYPIHFDLAGEPTGWQEGPGIWVFLVAVFSLAFGQGYLFQRFLVTDPDSPLLNIPHKERFQRLPAERKIPVMRRMNRMLGIINVVMLLAFSAVLLLIYFSARSPGSLGVRLSTVSLWWIVALALLLPLLEVVGIWRMIRKAISEEGGMRGAAGLAVAGLALLVACDGGPRGGGMSGAPVVLEASDVEIVGRSTAIGEVRDLEVLPDGSVRVLNSAEPFFLAFGPDGELVAPFGTSGGGPEEFRRPSAFVTGGIAGQAWVFDFRKHSLIRVSAPGEEWREIPLPRDSIPPGSLRGGMNMMSGTVRTARLGEEILLPRTTGSMDSGIHSFRMAILGADLLALDPEGGSIRKAMAFGEVLDDPSAGFESTEGGFPLWYRLWAVCGGDDGGDEIVLYDRVGNQIRRFDPAGAELAPMPLPPVAFTEATPRQFARAVFSLSEAEAAGAVGARLNDADSARLMNEILQRIQGSPQQLASYLPRYVDLRCGDDGTTWVQPYDLDAGGFRGRATWLRLTPGGEAQQVRFPDRFDPFRFVDGRAWGVQRDELDVASIAWVPLPEAGGPR